MKRDSLEGSTSRSTIHHEIPLNSRKFVSYQIRESIRKTNGIDRGSREETENGRANLLVSRLDMIYALFDQNSLFNRDFQKRLTGRFALPNAIYCICFAKNVAV
jgi:hypothetical protein